MSEEYLLASQVLRDSGVAVPSCSWMRVDGVGVGFDAVGYLERHRSLLAEDGGGDECRRRMCYFRVSVVRKKLELGSCIPAVSDTIQMRVIIVLMSPFVRHGSFICAAWLTN